MQTIIMMIPIVLTATVVPNIEKARGPDWKVRRNQYLEAIAFYKEFSKVYFIENSCYDLASDPAFTSDAKCSILKFPVSESPERGKGYQEFEMLDRFVRDRLTEGCFVKVTGRHIYANFAQLFSFLQADGYKYDVVIDRLVRMRIALTGLFCVDKQVYLRQFQNSYLEMHDQGNVWAEHVIYALLKRHKGVAFFPTTPLLQSDRSPRASDTLKLTVKNLERRVFSALNVRQLFR